MTAIRECQALMSLKTINSPLLQMIIQPPLNCFVSAASDEGQGFIKSLTNFQSNCPSSVPLKLWESLCAEYNESQLKAINQVCSLDASKESSITLLQGPPGTGKTKTILAIISVFLCGVLNPKVNGFTKVVAGSSFKDKETTYSANQTYSYSKSNEIGDLGLINNTNIFYNSSVKILDVQTDRKPRVLICAPSNTAVDELVVRLVSQVSPKLLKLLHLL
jgi:senataxin